MISARKLDPKPSALQASVPRSVPAGPAQSGRWALRRLAWYCVHFFCRDSFLCWKGLGLSARKMSCADRLLRLELGFALAS